MNEIKKVPVKLRGRETILVDAQILRRRKMLRDNEIVLGRASMYQDNKNKKQAVERAMPDPTKRKFFE